MKQAVPRSITGLADWPAASVVESSGALTAVPVPTVVAVPAIATGRSSHAPVRIGRAAKATSVTTSWSVRGKATAAGR